MSQTTARPSTSMSELRTGNRVAQFNHRLANSTLPHWRQGYHVAVPAVPAPGDEDKGHGVEAGSELGQEGGQTVTVTVTGALPRCLFPPALQAAKPPPSGVCEVPAPGSASGSVRVTRPATSRGKGASCVSTASRYVCGQQEQEPC